MAWLVLAAIALVVALAGRWAASALWVRMISDRWNAFDAAAETDGPAARGDEAQQARRT